MKRIGKSLHRGKTEYTVLRKDDRPLVVESSRLDEAFASGAESYPLACNADFECWIELPDEHYLLLLQELDTALNQS